MSKIFTCSCCGADVTSPQFFQGKVYGWTCIKRANPAAKQVKTEWLKIEGGKVTIASEQSMYAIVKGVTESIIKGQYIAPTSKHITEVKIKVMPDKWVMDKEGNVYIESKTLFPKRIS